MSRKGGIRRRITLPDQKHNDVVVQKLINKLILCGKKSVAEGIFYSALDHVSEKTKSEGLKVFKKAIDNIKPSLEVKSRRVGGATYQVPVEIMHDRKISLALRWLVTYAKARPERGMTSKLAAEIMDAANNRGGSVKKKEDTHKMAEANKAFAHYRW
ncbi:MAG: 30S ribosomal protein S7 [Deltaproteobacteria bacterium]|nr:30S ribosomal protein S7 [Deltaproteobacteria bacterium]